jgi:hypothetical protein
MRKILKGAIVLFVAAIMILTTFAATADTVNYKNESPDVSIALNNEPYHEITPIPLPSGRATLWDNGLPDGTNGLSCVLSSSLDREVVDDFIVGGEGWYVSDAHCRILLNLDGEPSTIAGFKVFFYQNEGTECNPVVEQYAAKDATVNAYHTGDTYFSRREIAVDLEFEKVLLEPGRWWICLQPVVEDNCFWLTAAQQECPVFVSYPDLAFPKWTAGNVVFGEDLDVSFQITGAEKTKSLNLPFFQFLREQSLLFRFLQQLF